MIIINSLKPFYIDKKNKIIRMGNFKDNAKEIEYDDNNILLLFESLKEPITKKDLIDKLKQETGLSVSEINETIDYLMSEGFIIDYDEYQNICNDEELNRQKLFFSMTSNNLKDWKLNTQPNILILGLGGVGSNVAVVLARSGFTNFTLVDFDKVRSEEHTSELQSR